MQAYEAREVRPRGRIAVDGIDLKVYELFAPNRRDESHPEPEALGASLRDAGDLLSSESDRLGHAAGFVIAHYARDGDYLLASRWCGINMLRHRVFALTRSGDARRIALEPLPVPDIVACVWELEIIKFERDQWARTVMGDPSGMPTADTLRRYLTTTFSGSV